MLEFTSYQEKRLESLGIKPGASEDRALFYYHLTTTANAISSNVFVSTKYMTSLTEEPRRPSGFQLQVN